MILSKNIIGDEYVYISMDGIDPQYYWSYNWKPHIISFTPPQLKMPETWGGLCQFQNGSIVLSPEVFENAWPPQKEFQSEIYHTASNDAVRELLFLGTAHRVSIKSDAITYDLHDWAYDQDLLSTTTNYDNDIVVLPRVFGWYQHLQCVRLPDVSGNPTYHNGYMTGTMNTDWKVYDDGVDITSNAVDNSDYTFYLTVSAVGTVTVTGQADHAYLSDLVEWVAGLLNLNAYTDLWHGDINDHPSADIRYVARSQEKLVAFASRICAGLGHMAYIR